MADALSTYGIGEVRGAIGFYKTLFRLHDTAMRHCVPAIVRKYDRASGIAQVVPLVMSVCETEAGETLAERPTYSVPVRRIRHGGFTVDIPLFAGDTGWLIAGDRSSSKARRANSTPLTEEQDGEEYDSEGNSGPKRPDTNAICDFSFGFFIPDYWGSNEVPEGKGMTVAFTPSGEDNEDRKVQISIDMDGVSVKRGAESVSIGDEGISYEGKPDREQQIVTDIRYDPTSHQLQKRTVTQSVRGDFVVGVSEESDWTMAEGGQAVPEKV